MKSETSWLGLPRRHCSIYQTRQRCLFLDVQYWKWIADEARSQVTRCIAKCFISHKAKWLNDQLKIWQKSPQVHKKLSHKWSTESAMKSSANPAEERGLQPSIRGKRSSFRSTKSKSNVSFSVLKILSIIILIIVLCFLVTFSVNVSSDRWSPTSGVRNSSFHSTNS